MDGIGPRLTGSPNMAKANAWTRDTLTAIGLKNAHLEDWGEFGMGWQQINTWARMVTPDPEPLWLQAAPWSPATKGPVTGEVVYVAAERRADLDKLKGKLAGKIVLLGAMRPTPDITEPLFHRYTDAELKEMESVSDGAARADAPDGQTSQQLLADAAAADGAAHAGAEDDGRRRRGWRSSRRAAMAATAAGRASSSTTTARTWRAMRRSRRTRSRSRTR